ncbi:unnamed protein product [Pedinophyceae sp. YPF-701]|nr:unnamed protein product [Pedinophyceae sp. YPF-701]
MAGDEAGHRVIYYISGSFFAWRVLIALYEKGLPVTERVLSLKDGELKSQNVVSVNPRGQSPTFIDADGTRVVHDSTALLLYLDEAYPNHPPVLPTMGGDKPARALALQRLQEANTLVDAILPVFGSHIGRPPFKRVDVTTQAGKDVIRRYTVHLARELRYWDSTILRGTRFVLGEFSLVDAAVAPFIMTMAYMGADFKHLPNVARYAADVAERESVQRTWPPTWRKPARGIWAHVFRYVGELTAPRAAL